MENHSGSSADRSIFSYQLVPVFCTCFIVVVVTGEPGDEPAHQHQHPAQEDQGHGAPHQLNQIHSGRAITVYPFRFCSPAFPPRALIHMKALSHKDQRVGFFACHLRHNQAKLPVYQIC